jgi:hypothetical protein
MDIETKIKTCKVCGSTENKFAPHRYTCTKCRSKVSNLKNNDRNYYKEYYIRNREAMLSYQNELYKAKKMNNINYTDI